MLCYGTWLLKTPNGSTSRSPHALLLSMLSLLSARAVPPQTERLVNNMSHVAFDFGHRSVTRGGKSVLHLHGHHHSALPCPVRLPVCRVVDVSVGPGSSVYLGAMGSTKSNIQRSMSNFNMLSSVIVNVVLGIVVHQTLRHHVEQQAAARQRVVRDCALGLRVRDWHSVTPVSFRRMMAATGC